MVFSSIRKIFLARSTENGIIFLALIGGAVGLTLLTAGYHDINARVSIWPIYVRCGALDVSLSPYVDAIDLTM